MPIPWGFWILDIVLRTTLALRYVGSFAITGHIFHLRVDVPVGLGRDSKFRGWLNVYLISIDK